MDMEVQEKINKILRESIKEEAQKRAKEVYDSLLKEIDEIFESDIIVGTELSNLESFGRVIVSAAGVRVWKKTETPRSGAKENRMRNAILRNKRLYR